MNRLNEKDFVNILKLTLIYFLLIILIKFFTRAIFTNIFFYFGVANLILAFILRNERFKFLPKKSFLFSKDIKLTRKDILKTPINNSNENIGHTTEETKKIPYYLFFVGVFYFLLSIIFAYIPFLRVK